MKSLLAFLLLVSPAWAACEERSVVTDGATLGARLSDGRPIINLEGVGGVTIRHRGDGSGGFTTTRECDPERAARLREKLERILAQE